MNVFADHIHRSVNETTVTMVTHHHTTIMESTSVSSLASSLVAGSKSCPSIGGATSGAMTGTGSGTGTGTGSRGNVTITSPARVLSPDSTAHSLRERVSPIATTSPSSSPNSSTCTSPSSNRPSPSPSLEQSSVHDEEMEMEVQVQSSSFSPLLSRALAASPESATSCMNGLVFRKPFEQLGASFSRSILGIQVPVSAFEALNVNENEDEHEDEHEHYHENKGEDEDGKVVAQPEKKNTDFIWTETTRYQTPPRRRRHGIQQTQTPILVEVATKGNIPFLPTPENSPGARSFSSKSLARRGSGTGNGNGSGSGSGGYKLTPRSASASASPANSIRSATQDFGTLLIPPFLPWCRDDPNTKANMNIDMDDDDDEECPIVGEQIVEFGDEFKTCIDMQSQYSSFQDESSMYHDGDGDGDGIGDNDGDGYDKINPTGSILSHHSHVDESVEWTRMACEYEEAGDYTSALHYYEQCWDLICFNGNHGGHDDDSVNGGGGGSQMMIRNQSKKMATLLLSIGNIHWKTGNYEKSLKILTMARTNMEEAIADTDRQDRKLRWEIIEELCEILNSIGRLHHSLGNWEDSLRYHQKSYVALKSLHDSNRENDRGKSHTSMNEDEKDDKVEDVKPQRSDGSGSDSDDKNANTNTNASPHPAVARALVLMGTVQTSRCQYDKALSHFKEGLIIQRQVLGNSHVDLAATMNALGSLYEKTQEPQRAMQCYKKARQIYLEQLGEDHVDYAVSLNNMGQVYHRLGNNKKAMGVYSESLKVMRRVLGRGHRNCSAIMYNMGLVHLDCSHHDQAMKMFRQTLKLQRRALGDRHIDVALTLESIGGIYEHKFKMDRALKLYRTALRIRRKVSSNHIFTAITLDRIGTCQMTLNGAIRESIECFDEALQIFELNGMPEDDPLVRVAHRNFVSASKLLELEQNRGGRF